MGLALGNHPVCPFLAFQRHRNIPSYVCFHDITNWVKCNENYEVCQKTLDNNFEYCRPAVADVPAAPHP